jgi:hypothetical protein
MSSVAELLHAHAAALTQLELGRRGSPVGGIGPDQRDAVAAVAVQVAAEVADGVLEHARLSPPLASALVAIYGDASTITPPVVEAALEAAD